jgi:WD40 repeat protein
VAYSFQFENKSAVKKQIAILTLMLGLIFVSGQKLSAQEKTARNKAEQAKADAAKTPAEANLWITENLPDSAVWRYGATDRNPKAIGIYALCFSSDGNLLAARDKRQNIRLLNIAEQKLQAIMPTENVLDLTFSPDDKCVVSGGRQQAEVWNVEDGSFVREISQPSFRVARTLDPPQLILVGKGIVQRYPWPLPSKPSRKQSGLVGNTILPSGLSADGRVIGFHNGRKLELLDSKTGELIEPPSVVPRKAVVSPNHQLMADLKFGNNTIKVFDLRDAKKYYWSFTHGHRIVTATFSNDSRFLFTSHYDNSIVIWDLVTMKQIDRLKGHAARVHTLAAPPQLFCLASGSSGSSDRSIIYWDFRDRLFPEVEGQADFLLDRVWTQLGSEDSKVSLAATNQLYRALQRDESLLEDVARRLGINSDEQDAVAERWIKDLDDRKYQVREKATAMLKQRVDQIRPVLERELQDCSQEAKWRIRKVLAVDRLQPGVTTESGRREHRVVLAIEMLGNENAMETLGQFLGSESRQTLISESKAAIDRLGISAQRLDRQK